ncbi:MAG: hypothetical protein DI630_16800 [Gordonia sp. (in: high G+C Gram-positive bacteria)]|nr:MAG: hypothetical protein DI630_16800 [Gordonia sp. (in: high G+C Gram-positive bacteria)]
MTIPAADPQHQWGLLIAGISAAVGEGSADASQIAALRRHVLPRIEKVQRLNRVGNTAVMETTIDEARTQLTQVMGEHWQPDPNGQVARALRSRGVDPSTITG